MYYSKGIKGCSNIISRLNGGGEGGLIISKKREIILEQSLNRGACVLVISSREVLISFMGGQKIVYNTQVGVGESIETIGAFYTSEYRYKQFY